VSPGTDVRLQPQAPNLEIACRPENLPAISPAAHGPLALDEEHRRLLRALRVEREGMTLHRLAARLSWSLDETQGLIENLVERQVVCRLNTVIPTYMCRYEDPNVIDD
jgi:hypothetical protein